MKGEHLIPLILFGSLLLILLVMIITGFLIMHKQRTKQYQMKLKEQEYHYRNALLATRIEVQEEALNRISRELHDNIGQVLGIARMKLLHATNKETKNGMLTLMQHVAGLIGKSMNDVRNLSHIMNGELMEHLELRLAIDKEINYIRALCGIECTFSYPEETMFLSKEQQLLVFRIVQEGLTNIIKHACASSIGITVIYSENKLFLSIADNGIGMELNTWQKNIGLGLINMKHRVKLLKGQMDMQSQAGNGTVITVWFNI